LTNVKNIVKFNCSSRPIILKVSTKISRNFVSFYAICAPCSLVVKCRKRDLCCAWAGPWTRKRDLCCAWAGPWI